jgi:hypothetical protein
MEQIKKAAELAKWLIEKVSILDDYNRKLDKENKIA